MRSTRLPRDASARPEISVVIPTYERADSLARCLRALAQQALRRDAFEVIVVDDGSTFPASEVSKTFAGELGLETLRQANQGPATARNRGAAQARGRYLAFTDDDCAPRPEWLASLYRAAESRPGAAFGGHTRNALGDNLFSEASQVLVDYLYGYFNRRMDETRAASDRDPLFTSNNLLMPREGFHQIGGFPEDFPDAAAEDRELCARWKHAGFEIFRLDEAVVDHHHALDWRGFVRQHFTYGRGAFRFQCLRRQRGDRQHVEPLRFYLGLVLHPIGRMSFFRSLAITGLLGVAQVANAAGYFWQKRAQS